MYRSVLRVVTVLAVIGAFGTAGLVRTHAGQGQAPRLAFSASDKTVTFATDPSMYGGGDQGMDNLYTLDTNICTDGMAVKVVYQSLGDVGNTGHEGHSLQIGNVQDYGTTGTTIDSPSTVVPVTEGSFPRTLFTADDNTAGSGTPSTDGASLWTGQIQKVHFATAEDVGKEVVASFVRRDHGFILNEDDDPRTDQTINGDDQGTYGGWTGSEDGANGMPPALGGTGADGDFEPNTDGSSFDDILRTDQQPTPAPGTTLNPSDPAATPSFEVVPNPATSTVSDCVIDQAAPQTTVSTSPSANPNGWYAGPVSVSLAAHKVYYLGGATVTHYNLDGTGWKTGTGPISVAGGGTHTLVYYSADSVGDTETTQTATINIIYSFKGFFQPVDNPPVVNTAKAGSAIPVKFSLTGNQGLSIFALNSPSSQPMSCSSLSTDQTSAIDQTAILSGTALTYDSASDQYSYVWKTQSSWTGCRILTATLIDGTVHTAYFRFK